MDATTCDWPDCPGCAAVRAFDEKWKRGEIKARTPIRCEYEPLTFSKLYGLDLPENRKQAGEFMAAVAEALGNHEDAQLMRSALKRHRTMQAWAPKEVA